MVNRPLVRPCFWGRTLEGGWLTCHSRFLSQENPTSAHVQLILRLCWCPHSRYALDRRSERVDGLKNNQHWMDGILEDT